jgi:integrase
VSGRVSRYVVTVGNLEIVSANPASRIKKSREQGRERFLSPDETARLADALAGRPGASADAVKLLLLTGSRSSEVFKAEWSEFNIAGAEWCKPSRRTKDGKTHVIPLNAPAIAVLSEMHGKAGDSPYLFPGPNGKPLGSVKRFWSSIS